MTIWPNNRIGLLALDWGALVSTTLTGKSEKEDKSAWSDQVWAESAHGNLIGHLVSDVNHGQSINTAAVLLPPTPQTTFEPQQLWQLFTRNS